MVKNSLGEFLQIGEVEVFFGNRFASETALENEFSSLNLARLKQIHSALVVESIHPGCHSTEADGHFTRVRGLALGVRTADCLPVMIYEPTSGIIAGVHAGWRGIESEIIPHALKILANAGARLEEARVWIGPHIATESFEVGLDVAERLMQAHRRACGSENPIAPHIDPGKAKVNLLMIARAQITALGVSRIDEHVENTVASNHHSSFRRDRDKAGRQFSFIRFRS